MQSLTKDLQKLFLQRREMKKIERKNEIDQKILQLHHLHKQLIDMVYQVDNYLKREDIYVRNAERGLVSTKFYEVLQVMKKALKSSAELLDLNPKEFVLLELDKYCHDVQNICVRKADIIRFFQENDDPDTKLDKFDVEVKDERTKDGYESWRVTEDCFHRLVEELTENKKTSECDCEACRTKV